MSVISKVSAIAALGMLVSSARTSAAQTLGKSLEIRFTSGAFIPTGSQRTALKGAEVNGAQVSWVLRPSLAITGTFAWVATRDLVATDTPKLDVFTYDLGAEARPSQWFAGHAVTFNPFVGAGAGARSYNYRSLDVNATHNLSAYATAGGELGYRRVGLRLEVRDYATGFKPLAGAGKSEARNDVVIMAGLRFKSR